MNVILQMSLRLLKETSDSRLTDCLPHSSKRSELANSTLNRQSLVRQH